MSGMPAASLWAWADIRRRPWSLLALAVLVALPIGFSLPSLPGDCAPAARSTATRSQRRSPMSSPSSMVNQMRPPSIVSPTIPASPASTARTQS